MPLPKLALPHLLEKKVKVFALSKRGYLRVAIDFRPMLAPILAALLLAAAQAEADAEKNIPRARKLIKYNIIQNKYPPF